jgi:hypothetical protein
MKKLLNVDGQWRAPALARELQAKRLPPQNFFAPIEPLFKAFSERRTVASADQ